MQNYKLMGLTSYWLLWKDNLRVYTWQDTVWNEYLKDTIFIISLIFVLYFTTKEVNK